MAEVKGLKASVTLRGLEATFAKLATLDDKLRKQATRKGLAAAGRVILKAMRPKIRKSTDPRLVPDLLRKALGAKAKTYRNSGVVILVIGPRTGFKRNKKTKQREMTKFARAIGIKKVRAKGLLNRLMGRTTGKTVYQNPTQYAHLAGPGRKEEWRQAGLRIAAEAARQALIDKVNEVIGEVSQ